MESHPARHMTSQSGRGMAHGHGMNSWIITQWSQRQPASQKYWNAPLKAQLMYHARRWKNRVPFFRTQCTYSVGDLDRCAPQQEGRRPGGISGSTTRPSGLLYASLCFPAQHLWALQGHTCSISYEATSMGIYITVYQLDFLIGMCFTN